ncbi:hypothetical protein ACFW04_006617 [Cataglyphis niger]
METLNILNERQKRLKEVILLHLLNTTLPNQLLHIRPILHLSQEKNIWMKERSGDWWNRIVNDHFKNKDWLEAYVKTYILWLCNEFRDELTPKENQLGTRESISVEKQVAVCLYFLASCCEYRVVGYVFGIHKSSVWKCVHKPDNHKCEDITAVFQRKTNIPQLIGAIDGIHIPIFPPTDGYRNFINRKGWPSIILQAIKLIIDYNIFRFRNIFYGVSGASHDAAVLKNSNLYKNCNLLIPYNRLTPEEESFNVYLNSGRVCVVKVFGRLKARWRRFIKRIDIYYSYVPHVISACCILHNIVEIHKESFTSLGIYK